MFDAKLFEEIRISVPELTMGYPDQSGFYWIQMAARGISWRKCSINLAWVSEIGITVISSPLANGYELDQEFIPISQLKDYAFRYARVLPVIKGDSK